MVNIHAVTNKDRCREIAKKYKWKLIETRETNDSILKVECIFEGQQTTFEVNEEGDIDYGIVRFV